MVRCLASSCRSRGMDWSYAISWHAMWCLSWFAFRDDDGADAVRGFVRMVAQVAVDDMQADASVFQDRVDRAQPDQIQWAVQRDVIVGERDASTADQVGGIPVLPRRVRLDRHDLPPIQATRTAAHRSIMAATVITMLPSEACGTTCSR